MASPFKLTPIKDYLAGLKVAIIFFSTLLGTLILLEFIRTDYIFQIPTSVQEMGGEGDGGFFTFPSVHLIKIILLAPIHGTISYIVFKKLLNQAIRENGSESPQMTEQKILLLEILLLWIIATIMMGHVMHWLFDRANSLYRLEYGDYNTDQAFLIVYFADEFLSHAIIHVGFFCLLTFGVYCESKITRHRRMNPDEVVIALILAFGVIILNGFAALGGESALILLVLSAGATIIMPIIAIMKKAKFSEHPLAFIMFLGSIGIVGYVLIHIALNPMLSYYPYIT
jgi:membrane-associated PAP2 superfamily phosphatase